MFHTYPFNFVRSEPRLRNLVVQLAVAFDQSGEANSPFGDDDRLLVEAEFARFGNGLRPKIDEPLMLVGVLVWNNTKPDATQYKITCQAFQQHSNQWNGFEVFLTRYIATVFSEPTVLGERFEFSSHTDFRYKNDKVQLVRLSASCSASGPDVANSQFAKLGSALHFGTNVKTNEALYTWFSDGGGGLICYLPDRMGPNYLCFVKFTTGEMAGRILAVVLQAKLSCTTTLTSAALRDAAVRSVTPKAWWRGAQGMTEVIDIAFPAWRRY